MPMSVLLIAAALCLSLSALAVGNLATLPARNRRARIRTAATYGNVRVSGAPERVKFRDRVVGPVVAWLARAMLRLNAKQNLESLSLTLMSAGMRNTSPQTFLAAKGMAGGTGLLLGMAIGAFSSVVAAVMFALILGAIGYIAPAVVVSARARRRKSAIVSQLPDALDLLAVSVEAGLGFDGAVAKLTQYMSGPLTEEFELALGEMRIGESRSDALKKLADRAGTAEVSSFVRSIVQADQLGTSLGRILRVQATDTRLKRQAAAEERAMKAPIKMLFPTVAFIFPAMFIVVLGPALLSLGKVFGF
jgi:tight adherence protein C